MQCGKKPCRSLAGKQFSRGNGKYKVLEQGGCLAYFRRTRRLAWRNVVNEEKMLEHEIRKSAVDQIMGELLDYGKKKKKKFGL